MDRSLPSSASPSRSSTPNPRFTSQNSTAEDLLKNQTVGLVTLDDFRKRRAEALDTPVSGASTPREGDSAPKFKKKKKAVKKGGLSFGDEEGDDSVSVTSTQTSRANTPLESAKPGASTPAAEEGDAPVVKKKLGANASVGFTAKSMTKSALLRDAQQREQLRKEFLVMQEAVKATDFVVPFVFYDGTNIPGGICRVKKGDFIWVFLDRARKVGAELGVSNADSRKGWARVSVDDLMLVRGDLIIPHHYEFYYFMVNKTIGYNGTLFPHSAEPTPATPATPSTPSTPAGGLAVPNPSAKTDKSRAPPPLVPDSDLEGFGDDPAITKVVDRRWYEKNKHIFPASTWEDFDPTKDYTKGGRKDVQGNAFFFSR